MGLCLVLSNIAAVPAKAVTLLYDFKAASPGGGDFTFEVDSQPVTYSVTGDEEPPSPRGYTFLVWVANATYGGSHYYYGDSLERLGVVFLTANVGGGLSSVIGGGRGPLLFSGSPDKPTLLTGNFAIGQNGSEGRLTVRELTSPVPETTTWAMMILGFFGVGFALRRGGRSRKAYGGIIGHSPQV